MWGKSLGVPVRGAVPPGARGQCAGGECRGVRMRLRVVTVVAGVLAVLPGPSAEAQGFATAAEVRPILEATRANWVALRPWDGKELLYFTHLESWRCGIAEVRFSVNSAALTRVWAMDPCFEGTAQPNAIGADRQPYTDLPAGLAETVSVLVILKDGAELRQDYMRAQILMP